MSDPKPDRLRHNWNMALGALAIVAVVVVITGGMALASAIQEARIAAQRTQDKGNLKVLALALHNYHDQYGQFPPPYLADKSGRPMHSWRVLILPFFNEQDLYDEYRFSEPWDGPNNRKLESRMPQAFRFHGLEPNGNTTTNVLAVVGPETMWPTALWPDNPRFTLKDVKDDMANTILIVENYGAGIHWMEPRDLAFQDMDFKLNSPAGVSCLHLDPLVSSADGQIKRLGTNITSATLKALLTVNGHEKIRQDANRNWLPVED
ncbi:MAG: hypothetical protein JWM11_7771 [Planctomycetaceae bacterium]|nr:hypothetical protein [Planctomycetaceae bacterium]